MRIIVVCLSLVVCMNVYGTQFRGGDDIVILGEEVIEDDLFVGAQRLTVMGTIDGDLIAGGRNIGVDGQIWGDVIAGAEFISISGHVDDDARLAAREITVTGTVGSNVLCFCQNLKLKSESEIGKDLTVYAGDILMEGHIGGNLKGAMGTAIISGTISGDVDISTESLLILSSSEIMGDLIYTSSKSAEIREGSQIRGQIVHRVKEKVQREYCPSGFSKFGRIFHRLKWIFKIIFLVGSLIVGLVFVAVAPGLSKFTAGAIKASPWKCIGLGLLTLVVVPIVTFIVSLTGIGLPLAMIVFALYLIGLYLSSIVFGIFLGKSFFSLFGRDISTYLALIFGVMVLFFLGLIPYLGWVIKFITLLFGLGAIILAAHRKRKELRKGAAA